MLFHFLLVSTNVFLFFLLPVAYFVTSYNLDLLTYTPALQYVGHAFPAATAIYFAQGRGRTKGNWDGPAPGSTTYVDKRTAGPIPRAGGGGVR